MLCGTALAKAAERRAQIVRVTVRVQFWVAYRFAELTRAKPTHTERSMKVVVRIRTALTALPKEILKRTAAIVTPRSSQCLFFFPCRANRKTNAESDRVVMEGNSKCRITKPFDSSIHVYTIGLEYSIPVAKFEIFWCVAITHISGGYHKSGAAISLPAATTWRQNYGTFEGYGTQWTVHGTSIKIMVWLHDLVRSSNADRQRWLYPCVRTQHRNP